jgi:hypothetical protein
MRGTQCIGVVSVLVGMLLCVFCFPQAGHTIPQTINYQGYLTDADGYPLDGTVDMVFYLYDVDIGGNYLWKETQTGVQVTDGLFSVNLGEVIPINLPFDTQYYLGIIVGEDTEMTPRQPVTSVGYAYRAGIADAVTEGGVDSSMLALDAVTADKIDDGAVQTAHLDTDAVTTDKLDDDAVTSAKILNDTVTADDIVDGSGSSLDADTLDGLNSGDFMLSGADDWVDETGDTMSGSLVINVASGDGLSSTTTSDVNDTSAVYGNVSATTGATYGVRGESNSNSGYGVYGRAPYRGVYGWANASSGTSSYGVNGRSNSTIGRGVYGYASASSGTTYGVYGKSDSTEGSGVYGSTSSSIGTTYGVYGESNSSNGYGLYGTAPTYGVYGLATASSGSTFGIYGRSDSTSGIAVYGRSFASSGDTYGVYGVSASITGRGVYGLGYTDSGVNYGVYGESKSGYGYGGYFSAANSHGVGIYAYGGPSGYAADFQGNVRIRDRSSGDTVMELGTGLDYAEGFDVSHKKEITPGSVLIIDPENPGKLTMGAKPYDTRVAGIVAGANGTGSGVRLGAGRFDYDVALAGRVYCNVDATESGVEPGDLLTTSGTPGYAMKATDYGRAHGAILGKAMQKLEKGQKGQILVLVTLQ